MNLVEVPASAVIWRGLGLRDSQPPGRAVSLSGRHWSSDPGEHCDEAG